MSCRLPLQTKEVFENLTNLLLSAKHDLPMPNLFITSGWAWGGHV